MTLPSYLSRVWGPAKGPKNAHPAWRKKRRSASVCTGFDFSATAQGPLLWVASCTRRPLQATARQAINNATLFKDTDIFKEIG
mmetsp:Transcript_11294/g.21277  ORF Transcript_11294/g.21277 Transcript_11294/m.21277 type:complete len:83 (-) Transcript_11294:84-332(-)